jgi:ubiquinone/menaquinone biosynthesis C-methylase UbiE
MDDRTTVGLIQRARPIGPSDRILDLGTGAVSDVLRERLGAAASVTTFEARPASTLPFADGSFELTLCQHLAHFADDLGPALAEVRRVLTPGGRFIGSTSQEGETVRAALLETGFTDVSIERSGTAAVLSARRP